MSLFICNTVRRQHTRRKRMATGFRHRFKQIICNGKIRLVRNRPVPLSEELLEKHLEELRGLQEAGVIEIRIDGHNGPVYDFGSPPPKEVKDDEPKDEEEAADAPEEEMDAEPELEAEDESDDELEEEEEVDIDRMRKAELVEYAAGRLDEDPAELEKLTMAEIKEMLQ